MSIGEVKHQIGQEQEPEETGLGSIYERLSRVSDRLGDAISGVSAFNDRVAGPVSREIVGEQDGTGETTEIGLLSKVRYTVTALEEGLSTLEHKINRLNEIG